MKEIAISFDNVSYIYEDKTEALKGISFKIYKGESVAIIGENGAGKSTLLKILAGVFLPSFGECFVSQTKTDKKNISQIQKKVGMVFQNSDDQLFMPTVREDISFGLSNMGLSKENIEIKADEAMLLTNTSLLANRPPYKLSQGEKKAVAIAGVLAMSPDILAMDEPTSNLDVSARRNLINLLKTFNHSKVIATHDLPLALETAQRAILLKDGKIAADIEVKDLIKEYKKIALIDDFFYDGGGCFYCGK